MSPLSPLIVTLLVVVGTGPDALFDDLGREDQKRVEPAAATDAPAAGANSATEATPSTPPNASSATPAVEAPVSPPAIEAPAVDESSMLVVKPVRRAGGDRPWRIQVALGVDHPRDESLEWFGDPAGPAMQIRLERSVDRWVDGFSIYAAGNFGSRGRTDHLASMTLVVAEAELGAALQWPGDGFWGWIFPYGRVGVSAAYVQINAGSDLEDGLLMAGFGARIGSRFHFGRVTASRRVSFYGFFEGGYAFRSPRNAKLQRPDPDEENPILPGPAVRLGSINLSAPEWRVGIGLAF